MALHSRPAPYQRALQRPSSSNTHDGVPRLLRNPGRPIIFHTSRELVMSSPMLSISRESLCCLAIHLASLLVFSSRFAPLLVTLLSFTRLASLLSLPSRSRGGQSTSVAHGLVYALSSSAAFIPGTMESRYAALLLHSCLTVASCVAQLSWRRSYAPRALRPG